MTGQRGCFVADTFHHAAITTEGVDVVVKHLKVGAVEVRSHPAFGNGHADARRYTLTERTGGRFNSRGPAVFRVAWAFAVELAKVLDIIEGHGELANLLVFRVDGLDTGKVEQ